MAEADRFADRELNNLTDHQLYQKANDLLAARAILREFEAEWYGRLEVP
ncbi:MULTISPECIES: hypothetical protein [unclassified Mesorhizobium]|nr:MULTISPECIES: hypothetical protein [unclassified Mesorhizobium]